MSSENLSPRNPPPSSRQLLIIFSLFAGVMITIAWGIWLLIDNIVWLIPQSVEQQIGRLVKPVYEELALPSPQQDELNQLLGNLEAKLPSENREKRDYQVLYVPQKEVNAIALPGDAIVIYQGLLTEVRSENELMMILGHELGHFANRDHLRSLSRGLLLQAAIGTILGDPSILQSILGTAIANISQAQYSQSQELQADAFALELLLAYYGHVAGATDFFTRLAQQSGRDWNFLSTHPAPDLRVKALQRQIKAQQYPIHKTRPLPETLKLSPAKD
jgi:Zn-dependent protease with chaperone function